MQISKDFQFSQSFCVEWLEFCFKSSCRILE